MLEALQDEVIEGVLPTEALSQGLAYFTGPSNKGNGTGSKETEFVGELSQHLQLDEGLALVMLKQCIKTEVQLPAALRSLSWTDSTGLQYDQQLRDLVRQHYFQERLATLNLVSSLLRIADDPSNKCHSIASAFASDLLGGDRGAAFVSSSLKQLVTLGTANPLQLSPSLSLEWSVQNLEEQIAIAELLMLCFYSHVCCPSSLIVSIIDTLYSFSFGVDQPSRSFYTEHQHKRLMYLNHLLNIIVLEILQFEMLVSGNLKPLLSLEKDSLPEMVSKVDSIISASLQSRPAHLPPNFDSLTCLGWAVFIHLLAVIHPSSVPADSRAFIASLADLAFTQQDSRNILVISPQRMMQYAYESQNVFERLSLTLSFPPYSDKSGNYLALKSVLKGLLVSFFTTQTVSMLPKRPVLIDFCVKLFIGDGELSQQFWEEDYALDERRSLLDCTRRAFPIDFAPFIDILGSLIGNTKTAWYCFKYLKEVPSFADYLRSESYAESERGSFGENVVSKGGSLVYGANDTPLAAPKGTLGHVVGRHVVLLDFQYSAWVLFVSLLESYLHRPAHYDDSQSKGLAVGTSATTLAILKYFSTFLQYANQVTVDQLMVHLGTTKSKTENSPQEHLVSLLSQILDKSCLQQTPNLDLITYCIDCVRLLLPHFPRTVWKYLRCQMLLPQYTSSTWIAQQPSSSYMQRIILPLECSKGSYQATMAFLNLALDLVDEAQGVLLHTADSVDSDAIFDYESESSFNAQNGIIEDESRSWQTNELEVLRSIVTFVVHEIFPTHRSWRYINIIDKFSIGQKILLSFNKIIRYVCWANDSEGGSDTRTYLVSDIYVMLCNIFLESESAQHVVSLFDIMGTGNEFLASLHRQSRHSEASILEQSVTESLEFLAHLFEKRIELLGSNGSSILEAMLFDRTIRRGRFGTTDLVHIIGRYILYEPNPSLAKSSINLLIILSVAASSPYSTKSVSFVGCFGNDAHALVFTLIKMVEGSASVTMRYHPDLQNAILRFSIAILKSQPGLVAMLFSGLPTLDPLPRIAPESNTASTDTASKPATNTMIDATLNILKTWTTNIKTRPFVVLSALELVDALWQTGLDHFLTLETLRKCDEFWTSIDQIVFATFQDFSKHFEVADKDGKMKLNEDEKKLARCLYDSLRSHAIRIVVMEAYYVTGFQTKKQPQQQPTAQKTHSDRIMLIISDILKSDSVMAELFKNGGKAFPLTASITRETVLLGNKMSPSVDLRLYRMKKGTLYTETVRFGGSHYVFDVQLLEKQSRVWKHRVNRVYQLNQGSQNAVESGEVFIGKVKQLNWEWSLADAHLSVLKACEFYFQVTCLRLWGKTWPKSLPPPATSDPVEAAEKHLVELAQQIVRIVIENERDDSAILDRLSIICCIFRTVVVRWIRNHDSPSDTSSKGVSSLTQRLQQEQQQTELKQKTQIKQIVAFITMLEQLVVSVTSKSLFALGPQGKFSKFGFHLEILACVLFVLKAFHSSMETRRKQLIKKSNEDGDRFEDEIVQKVGDTCSSLIPFVCEGVSYLLSGDMESSIYQFKLSLSVLIELLRVEGIRTSVWLQSIERFQVIGLMLNAISKTNLAEHHQYDESYTRPKKTSDNSKEWTSLLLRVVLKLAGTPRFAEQLAVDGILTAFSTCAVSTQETESGITDSGLHDSAMDISTTRAMKAKGSQPNDTWCLVLCILTQLLNSLGHNKQFAQEVVGITQLFFPQILATFEYGLVLNNSTNQSEQQQQSNGVSGEMKLMHIQELEKCTDLLYRLMETFTTIGRISAVPFGQWEPGFVNQVEQRGSAVLSRVSNLYMSPYETMRLFVGSSGDGTQEPEDEDVGAVVEYVAKKMRNICRNLVQILLKTTSADLTVMQGRYEGSSRVVLIPKMASQREEMSSFGTLFNLVRFIVKRVEEEEEGKKPKRERDLEILEASLLLIASQVLVVQRESGEEEQHAVREAASELIQTLDDVQGLFERLQKRDDSNVMNAAVNGKPSESLDFIKFLRRLFI